jgi:hypothetical protein
MDRPASYQPEPLTANFYLLCILLFFKFIPFPVFRHFGLAFENVFFFLLLFSLLSNMKRVFGLGSTAKSIIMMLVIFFFAAQFFAYLRGEQIGSFFGDLKPLIYMMFIMVFCDSSYKLMKFMKVFLWLTVFSVIFGTLVYLFGGPFATIRAWLCKSQSYSWDVYIGKGSQLSGIYCPPAIFGYLMAVAPILCFALYTAEKKSRWLFAFIVCLMGLFLNAERTAMGLNVIMLGIWFFTQKNKAVLITITALALFAIVGMNLYMSVRDGTQDTTSKRKSSYAAGTLSERMKGTDFQTDVLGRIEYQMFGVWTVLEHPLIGATAQEYSQKVMSSKGAVNLDARRIAKQSKKTMAPHNHYVNAGMRTGLFGWLIALLIFTRIYKITRARNLQHLAGSEMALIGKALCMSLFAVLLVGMFHNAGIYSGELASCTVLALVMSLHNLKVQTEIGLETV